MAPFAAACAKASNSNTPGISGALIVTVFSASIRTARATVVLWELSQSRLDEAREFLSARRTGLVLE